MEWEGDCVCFQSSHNVTGTFWVLSSPWHIFCQEFIVVVFILMSFYSWGTLRYAGIKGPALSHVILLEPGFKAASGICDHSVCQDPKGKTIQLGTSPNCTWGWFWHLGVRFGEIAWVALLAWSFEDKAVATLQSEDGRREQQPLWRGDSSTCCEQNCEYSKTGDNQMSFFNGKRQGWISIWLYHKWDPINMCCVATSFQVRCFFLEGGA